MLSEQEPTDTQLLEFIVSNARSINLKMDGLSDWFMPSNLTFHCRAKTPREALVAAYRRYQEQLHAE